MNKKSVPFGKSTEINHWHAGTPHQETCRGRVVAWYRTPELILTAFWNPPRLRLSGRRAVLGSGVSWWCNVSSRPDSETIASRGDLPQYGLLSKSHYIVSYWVFWRLVHGKVLHQAVTHWETASCITTGSI